MMFFLDPSSRQQVYLQPLLDSIKANSSEARWLYKMYASYHTDIKVPMTLCQVTPPAVFSNHSFHFQRLNLNNVDLKIAGPWFGEKRREKVKCWELISIISTAQYMPENRVNNPFWTQSDIAQPALTILGTIRIIVMSSLHRCISHN